MRMAEDQEAPAGGRGRSLADFRDAFTSMRLNREVRNAVLIPIGRWRSHPSASDPVAELQKVIETMRRLPAGATRNRDMNTLVRTLGEPYTLATWLDILRDTYRRDGTKGQAICKILLSYRRHSHYGHTQLLMMVSARIPSEDTQHTPRNRIKHASQWDMTLSIWQPIGGATSFPSRKRSEPQLLVEPAHNHPFDFVSKVVVGTLYQSTYQPTTKEAASRTAGRYSGVELLRVDRTWPPHERREAAWLKTLEDRVPLRAGDSYYLPADMIHDVEMDSDISATRPAITLMLASNAIALPDVFLEQPMLDFHDANPRLKDADVAMPFKTWDKILRRAAAYLRGAPTLQLPRMKIGDSFLVH